jgi:putative heme iron utilization protein
MAQPDEASAWEARCLLRAARVGTLATNARGQPFASLVTPACAPDLTILLLLSGLSGHTRHLMADPRCSVLVVGTTESANPQTAPRLTVTGLAERVEIPELKKRYLTVHPYASLYADFSDFALWRIEPVAGLFVGGFGRAARLSKDALIPDADAVKAIAAAEASIIECCNRDQPGDMAAIVGQPGDWRMVTVDVDGFDVAQGDQVARFKWSAPVGEPAGVRRELVRMTEAAR